MKVEHFLHQEPLFFSVASYLETKDIYNSLSRVSKRCRGIVNGVFFRDHMCLLKWKHYALSLDIPNFYQCETNLHNGKYTKISFSNKDCLYLGNPCVNTASDLYVREYNKKTNSSSIRQLNIKTNVTSSLELDGVVERVKDNYLITAVEYDDIHQTVLSVSDLNGKAINSFGTGYRGHYALSQNQIVIWTKDQNDEEIILLSSLYTKEQPKLLPFKTEFDSKTGVDLSENGKWLALLGRQKLKKIGMAHIYKIDGKNPELHTAIENVIQFRMEDTFCAYTEGDSLKNLKLKVMILRTSKISTLCLGDQKEVDGSKIKAVEIERDHIFATNDTSIMVWNYEKPQKPLFLMARDTNESKERITSLKLKDGILTIARTSGLIQIYNVSLSTTTPFGTYQVAKSDTVKACLIGYKLVVNDEKEITVFNHESSNKQVIDSCVPPVNRESRSCRY